MDSYLEIARRVLLQARQPLTAQQILKAAYQLQIVPRDLYGRTQHKTLHARLSTDILKRRLRSDFYRTGPGRFFLRALKSDGNIAARYGTEYFAPLRSAQLGRFDVLVFPRYEVKRLLDQQPPMLTVGDLVRLHWRYCRMDEVRHDPHILAFRILVVLVDNGRLLLHSRGGLSERELPTRTTLGFDGVIKREDRSLFSEDEVGLPDAIIRTIVDGVELPSRTVYRLREVARSSNVFVLFEEAAIPAVDDLMVVVALNCSAIPEVAEYAEGIATMDWQPLPIRTNDVECFDRWSAKIASDPVLQEAIAH